MQNNFWTTWTTWTRSKSVKKNIIFFIAIKNKESKLIIFIVKTKKYKKYIFIFSDFHLVHLVQKSLTAAAAATTAAKKGGVL